MTNPRFLRQLSCFWAAVILSLLPACGTKPTETTQPAPEVVAEAKVIREVLRSVLEEGHRRRMEALSTLANGPERERLQALARQAREARLITVEKVGGRLAEHVFETPAPRDLVEIIRLLESPGGVPKAIARAEEMRAKTFPHGAGPTRRPVVRDELRPLLLLAILREFRGEVREAGAVYAQLHAVDPQWPYLVNLYSSFVRWESGDTLPAAN